MIKRPPRSAAQSATPGDTPSGQPTTRDVSFIAAQVLAMKATRLSQDLERLHEATDRAPALDAIAQRLAGLQAAVAKLAPATPEATAKAAAAKTSLNLIAERLAIERAGGEPPKKAGEDF